MSSYRREIHDPEAKADAATFKDGVRRLKEERMEDTEDLRSTYDQFVFDHADAASKSSFEQSEKATYPTDRGLIYHGPAMLPWNRYFLRLFEEAIRRVTDTPAFKLPYWDWNEGRVDDGEPRWPESVLGRFGEESTGYKVAKVPFGLGRKQEWIVADEFGRPAGPLKRMKGAPNDLPGEDAIKTVLKQKLYDTPPYNRASPCGFRIKMEGLLSKAHQWVGGTMLTTTAPNDPAYFLIRCNIDRLWQEWQGMEYVKDSYVSMDCPVWHRKQDPIYPWLRHKTIGDAFEPTKGLYGVDVPAQSGK